MAKARTDSSRAADIIKNWLRSRATLEFLGAWEMFYNPNFKVVEFDHFRKEAGLHTFTFEADMLNVIIFNMTAKDWRDENPDLAKKNNIRDFASIPELTVLSNLETHNAELIKDGLSKQDRFIKLKQIAKYQLRILIEADRIKMLDDKDQ